MAQFVEIEHDFESVSAAASVVAGGFSRWEFTISLVGEFRVLLMNEWCRRFNFFVVVADFCAQVLQSIFLASNWIRKALRQANSIQLLCVLSAFVSQLYIGSKKKKKSNETTRSADRPQNHEVFLVMLFVSKRFQAKNSFSTSSYEDSTSPGQLLQL